MACEPLDNANRHSDIADDWKIPSRRPQLRTQRRSVHMSLSEPLSRWHWPEASEAKASESVHGQTPP
jgi:hypothetical protein